MRGGKPCARLDSSSRSVADERSPSLQGLVCSLMLPEKLVELIAARAAAIVLERGGTGCVWPEWMSVETAARYLDVSEERVRKLKDRGVLPCYQEGPGCRVFFRRSELDEAMQACGVGGVSNSFPRLGKP